MATSLDDEDDIVAHWAIRLDGLPLSDDEQRDLDQWLEEDERRQGSLLRAQAALSYLDRGRALSTAEPAGEEREINAAPRTSRRGFLIGGGAVGGLLAASIAGFLFFTPGVETVRTELGEVRRVPLADGSVASLNTDSKIAVALAKDVREITLDSGEAFFQVAHDKARPFIVEAGQVRVQAVGTAFSVRRRADGAEILVTEGVVETWVAGREHDRKRIAAGARGFVAEAAPAINVEQAPGKIDRALAWRSGEIALDGESLAYAVEEINRYNSRKLVIDDPALAKEPLVGYFRTNEPENFGRAVAGLMGARVIEQGDTIRLVRGRS
jgi:transmembrane sensor